MPKFIQLKNEFQENGNIIFLTVSIDQERTRDKWLKAIQENNMTGLINLIISPTGDSHFETDYQIVGVPRYFIIDKEGKIITVFAPSPDKEMKDLIQNILKS